MQWMDQYYTGFSEAFHKKPSSMTIEAYFAGFPFPAKKKPVVIDIDGYYADISPFIEQDKIAYRANPPNLNIWEGIGIGRSELKHCSFLAWLLNPGANHCQGPQFFVLLLEEIGLLSFLDEAKAGNYQVFKEDSFSELGRIDITLIGKTFMVAIEAKIDADEQNNQLVRYRKVLEFKSKIYGLQEDLCKIIFLTKNSKPGKTGNADFSISWKIVGNVCKKFANKCENSFVSELVIQYSKFIKSTL